MLLSGHATVRRRSTSSSLRFGAGTAGAVAAALALGVLGPIGCGGDTSGGSAPIAERPRLFFDDAFATVLQDRVTKGWLAANVMPRFWTEVATDMAVAPSQLYPRGYGIAPGTALSSQFRSFEGGSRLARLGMAYLLSGNAAYARKAAELMPLYMADDPYDSMPVEFFDKDLAVSGWVRGLAAAFDWTYRSGELGSLDDPGSVASAVREHVRQGCDFLAGFLGSRPFAGNHDIIAGSAMALGAAAFPGLARSEAWIAQARGGIDGNRPGAWARTGTGSKGRSAIRATC